MEQKTKRVIRKPLNDRQKKYIKHRVKGKSRRQAALDAGYSPSVANNASATVESANVRAHFQSLIRRRITQDQIALRIAQGMEAKETKFFQHKGKVVSQTDIIAWGERREYAKLAAEYGGYFTPKQQIEASGPEGGPIRLNLENMTDEEIKAEIAKRKSVLTISQT